VKRLTVVLCLAAALAAGCGHSAAPRFEDSELSNLVLLPSDLPKAFQQFDEGRQVRADAHPGPRASATRFGRQDGWKARYHRRGDATTKGPLVIESRADVFRDGGGARKDLDAYAQEADAADAVQSIDVPSLGDEARGSMLLQGNARTGLRYYTVAWRDGRITASVSASGFAAGLRLADVVALARKQEARTREAG
jgi:hypothetical protein